MFGIMGHACLPQHTLREYVVIRFRPGGKSHPTSFTNHLDLSYELHPENVYTSWKSFQPHAARYSNYHSMSEYAQRIPATQIDI